MIERPTKSNYWSEQHHKPQHDEELTITQSILESGDVGRAAEKQHVFL